MKSSIKVLIAKSWNIPSRIGEKLGWEWLIYNPGVFVEFAMVAHRNAPLFAKAVKKVLPFARTYNDVGCGTGQFVKALKEAGAECTGYEYSRLARIFGSMIGVEIKPFDLGDVIPIRGLCRLDVAYSLEVGEHLPEFLCEKFVHTLTQAGKIVIFSAAQPGQAGHGHINCQSKEWWSSHFASKGYYVDMEITERLIEELIKEPRLSPFLISNIQVYRAAIHD